MAFNELDNFNNEEEKFKKESESLDKAFKSFFKEALEKKMQTFSKIESLIVNIIDNMDHNPKQIGDRVKINNPGGVFDDQDLFILYDTIKSDCYPTDNFVVVDDNIDKVIHIEGPDIDIELNCKIYNTRNKRFYYCTHLDLKLAENDKDKKTETNP